MLVGFFKNIFNKLSGQQEDSAKTETLTEIDEDYIDSLEEELIMSDLGPEIALDFCERLRADFKNKIFGKITDKDVEEKLSKYLEKFVDDLDDRCMLNSSSLSIFLLVGVNGVGKTTSVAKLASYFKAQGCKILLAAADTFRAAAEEQLQTWAERVGVDIVDSNTVRRESNMAADAVVKPSAVLYKAVEKAKRDDYDLLLVDSSGRLHNKTDLMNELAKLREVIVKNTEEASLCETLLVLDSTTGQNAISQAEVFDEVCDLTGVILTKFDGSSRGAVVFPIAKKFKLPVKFYGTGEGVHDLLTFSADDIVAKILS